jgi:hypothetical protein
MKSLFLLSALTLSALAAANALASEYSDREQAARQANQARNETIINSRISDFNAEAQRAIRTFSGGKSHDVTCNPSSLGYFDSCDFSAGNLACRLYFGQGMQEGTEKTVYNSRYACNDTIYLNSYVFNCIDQQGRKSQKLLRREGTTRVECN